MTTPHLPRTRATKYKPPDHCARCQREYERGEYGPYCSRHCVEEAMRCALPKNVKHPKPEHLERGSL